jgi:hypothetical protein
VGGGGNNLVLANRAECGARFPLIKDPPGADITTGLAAFTLADPFRAHFFLAVYLRDVYLCFYTRPITI